MIPTPEKFDPIYAAFAGAIITMIGSWVTAWLVGSQATRRQKNDLLHSSSEKQKERDFAAAQRELERLHTLRRECFLPFMDATAAAVGFVPSIPTCPIDGLRTLTPMVDLGRHISKITLIAPPSIIEPMMTGFLFLQTVATTLINQRWAIENVASDLDLNRNSVQMMLDRQKNLGERMDTMIDTGEPKPQLQHLYQQHTEIGERIQSLIGEQGPLIERKADLELRLQREAADLLMPLREHSITAIIAIRSEIGLPIDETWYRKFSDDTAQKALQLVTSFQDELRDKIITNKREQ